MISTALLTPKTQQYLQTLEASEDWDEVIRQCKLKVARQEIGIESKAAYYALMGKALVNLGKDEAAVAAYTESLARSPHKGENHYALGILYARIDKPARAICHYQKALQLQPDWAQVIFKLGNLFHRLGYSVQAYENYQRALVVDPNHVDTHVAIGVIHEQRREPRLAIKHYQQAAYLQPKRAEARRGVGRVLTKMEAYDAAVDVYQHMLRDIPNDAQAYSSLGQALLAKGDTQRAITAYRQAITIDNTLVTAHRNLGRLWQRYQDLEGATKCFEQALKKLPNSLPILSDYADVLMTKGDWETLIDSLRISVHHQPEWIASYCNRTVQLSDKDLLFRVQRTCGRFLIALQQAKSEQSTAILKERLGQIYEYMGDLSIACDAPERAEQCYRAALSIMPYALNVYVGLGDCLESQGRLAAATAVYQAGLLQKEQMPTDEVRKQMDNLPASAMTVADWQLQLERRWKTMLAQASASSTESPLSQCKLEDSCVRGAYPTVAAWLAKQAEEEKLDGEKLSREENADTKEDNLKKASAVRLAQANSRSHQCGGITCPTCMSWLIQKFSPVQVGKQSFRCSPMIEDVPTPSTFTVTIPNGSTWVAPQKNAWDVCNEVAVLTSDGFLIGDLSRAYPWYLPECDRYQTVDHSLLRRQSLLPNAKKIAGKVAVLSGLSGHIYYHWMFDVLPRIAILNQSLVEQNQTLEDIDFFVVNNFSKAFQKETLETLGIPIEKVIASDLVPHIQAQQLVVPSFAGHLDWVPMRSLTFLRNGFLKKPAALRQLVFSETSQTDRRKSKRLYITRKRAKYRYIFNEADVVKMLAQFGFVSVALETLSVAEQIELFSQAEVIVAPHGSGLTNLAFCQAGTTVIECFSPNYIRTDYWMISEYLKLQHYYLVGESLECRPLRQLMYPSGLTEDFSVDVGELRSLLRTAGVTA